MVKLIQLPGQTISSSKGKSLVDLTSAYEIINKNIKERERQARIDSLRAEQAKMQEEAKRATSFGNIAKLTGQNMWEMGKGLGKEIVGTTAAVGADLLNVLQPWKKDKIKSVNVFGQDFITPSERGSRAGELARQGEYGKAIGELGTSVLDIVSTIWIPGKGIQILKGGKYVKGALQGGIAGAGYGAGYGTTGAMREGAGAKETLKSGAVGAGIGIGAGATLGAGTALVGKLFSRKAEIIEKPQVFSELVGKPKNFIDYMATRPNLKIVETNNLGKSIDGGKIQSRLEWDYKNNKGILLMTKNTPDEAFAHEIGHYIDKSNPNLVNNYKKEVIALSGGKQNLNEDFAFAVKEIITNPEARKIAPKLTTEIEGLGIKLDEGFGVKQPKVEKLEVAEPPKRTTKPVEPIKPKVEVKTPSKYKTVQQGGKTSMVDGEPVKIVDGIDTFIHKDTNGNWVVSEVNTGKSLNEGGFPTQKHAIDDAKNAIDYYGVENIKKTISKEIPKPKTDPLIQEARKTPIHQFLENKGIKVNNDRTVTLYHGTSKEAADIIKKTGKLNPAASDTKAYLTPFKDRASNWSVGKGKGVVIEIKVPVDDVRYLPSKGINEIVGEGGFVKKGDVWVPKSYPKDDVIKRLAEKRFNKNNVSRGFAPRIPDTADLNGLPHRATGKALSEPSEMRNRTAPLYQESTYSSTDNLSITKNKTNVKSQPLQEGVKPKKTSEIKKTMSETPTAVRNIAKKTYQKELKGGATKKQATEKAIEKVEVYEKKIDKIAKEVSIIEQLKEARKKQGPTPRKKVKTDGVNWDTLNTSDETDDLLKTIYRDNEQFKDVRPSRTNQDIIEGARAVGIDVNNPAELDKVLRDMPNANTALKLKQSMVDSANDLMNYLKTIDTGTATAEQLNKVKDKFLRTQSIAKAFSGLRTESSHLLRSMGIEVREGENMAEMATKLKEILGESTDTSSFIRKSQEIINPTTMDTVQAIWYNSILSGWKTWTRNILDTTNSLVAETVSKGVNPATIIEVPRFVAGLVRGFPKSIVKAGKVLVGSEQFSNKMEYTTRVAPYFKNKHLNFWLTEVSGRILSAQDVVFHSTAKSALDMVDTFSKQMQRAGVGERTALELNEAMNKQLTDRIVYRNKPMGSIGAVSKGIGEIATKVKALKFIVPFTRVVANVTDRKIDYLPVLNIARTFGKKYITEEAKTILKSTSIPPSQYDKLMPIITKRLKDQQLGRLYLGTLFSVGAYALASNGRISGGGPSNANERKQLQETGWRPYSVKVGDKWIPYTYFGPLSGILAGAGSIHDSIKYDRKGESPTKLVANGLFGFAQNLMTTSFIQGVGDLFEVLSGRGLKPADYMRNFVLGLVPVPAMWTQTAQALDGKSYDIQTWGEAIQWKLGISKDGLPLTKNLTPRLNALGEDIRADLIYGITPAKERKEIQTKLTNMGLIVNVPAKTTKLGDETMTREQLFEYTKRRGDLIKKNLDQILSSVDTKQSKDEKEKEFKKWIDNIGDEAKNEMKTKYNIKEEKEITKKSLIKPKQIKIIK